MKKDETALFVEKANIVSANLTTLIKKLSSISPDAVDKEEITDIAEILEDITRARTSLQRFRLMERLETHAEHKWLIDLAVLSFAAQILEIKSINEINGTREIVKKLQEELHEDAKRNPPDGDCSADQ